MGPHRLARLFLYLIIQFPFLQVNKNHVHRRSGRAAVEQGLFYFQMGP